MKIAFKNIGTCNKLCAAIHNLMIVSSNKRTFVIAMLFIQHKRRWFFISAYVTEKHCTSEYLINLIGVLHIIYFDNLIFITIFIQLRFAMPKICLLTSSQECTHNTHTEEVKTFQVFKSYISDNMNTSTRFKNVKWCWVIDISNCCG